MRLAIFIGAHADDVELGAGGTCALLRQSGCDVRIIVMTDDEQPEVAVVRRSEAIAGAAALGVADADVHFLGLRDGHLRCDRDTVSALRNLIQSLCITPDVIFTHSDRDSHQDHGETLRIVRAAVRSAVICKFQVRNSAILSGFAPDVFSAVEAVYKAKVTALQAHHSQRVAGRIPFAKVRDFDCRFAAKHGAGAVEAFETETQAGCLHDVSALRVIESRAFNMLWTPIVTAGAITLVLPSRCEILAPGLSTMDFALRLQGGVLGELPSWSGPATKRSFDVKFSSQGDVQHSIATPNVVVLQVPEGNARAPVAIGHAPQRMAAADAASDPHRRQRRGRLCDHLSRRVVERCRVCRQASAGGPMHSRTVAANRRRAGAPGD